jgi:D-alanine transaminase
MDVATKAGLPVREEYFTVEDMMNAREVFISAATSICFPVISINNRPIGNGHPGLVSRQLRKALFEVAEKTAI